VKQTMSTKQKELIAKLWQEIPTSYLLISMGSFISSLGEALNEVIQKDPSADISSKHQQILLKWLESLSIKDLEDMYKSRQLYPRRSLDAKGPKPRKSGKAS
jgi:hypothetical protein